MLARTCGPLWMVSMSGLSDSKRRAMSILMDQAPEAVLEAIEARFSGAGGALATDVVNLARTERVERAVIRLAFGPVLPLFSARSGGVDAPVFGRSVPKKLWSEMERRRPDLTDTLLTLARLEPEAIAPATVADGLCAEAASILRGVEPRTLGLKAEDQAEDLAGYIDMIPIARGAIERLPAWLGRVDGEQLGALRLTFKDADALRDDGRARLMEMLMAQLPRASEILRVISALTERSSAGFIDGTELASFPSRLLSHAEALSASIRIDAGRIDSAEANAINTALANLTEIMGEFDLSFPGASGGAWTARLTPVRRRLTDQLEAAFRAMPKAVERALPLGNTRLAGRMSRLAPDLASDPEAPAVAQARALLQILDGTRLVASDLGCESARRAAADAIAERVDSYAEEALGTVHDGGVEDPDRALALIEVAAEFLSLSRKPEAGDLVRRRAAVALVRPDAAGSAAA